MIEVVLGLGLIAFGLISIAALFPSGLRANQLAIGETHGAQHADQFLHILKARMLTPDDDRDNWELLAESLPASKPGSTEPDGDDWSAWYTQGATKYAIAGDDREFYRIEQEGPDDDDIQFAAICRVWRTPITISHYSDGSWSDITFTVDEAIGLNVEISWPADKPYASRNKSLYQIEVYHTGS